MSQEITSPKMSFAEYQDACRRADEAMKRNNGHVFVIILKTRCQWCGRSEKAKGRCSGWFGTFLYHLAAELTGVYGVPQQLKEDSSDVR